MRRPALHGPQCSLAMLALVVVRAVIHVLMVVPLINDN